MPAAVRPPRAYGHRQESGSRFCLAGKVSICNDLYMTMPEAQWRPGDPVAAAEKLMLGSAASGQTFDGFNALPPAESEGSHAQGNHATVRAEVLRHLLTADDWPVDPKGVQRKHSAFPGYVPLAGQMRFPGSFGGRLGVSCCLRRVGFDVVPVCPIR